MITATSATRQYHLSPPSDENKAHDVIETRLWLEEHDWLYLYLPIVAIWSLAYECPSSRQ
ncbi:MAG: hypothetical protein IPJ12_01885 [Betaproteobacteria bacterium]|nr:hypothetical protein [Betaproteobacteria bacterium]